MKRDEETEASGPIPLNIWDTRTRENSAWCPYCEKWLRLSTFSWMVEKERLEYHQRVYCKRSPMYEGDVQ